MTPQHPNLLLNPEQQRAYEAITQGGNCIVSGGAGTGKSVLIRAVQDWARRSGRNMVTLCPTGVSALQVGGQTIHSFIRATGIVRVTEIPYLGDTHTSLVSKLDLVILDEAGMINASHFAALERILRAHAKPEKYGLPFGGVQIVAVLDAMQLPPVVTTWEESQYLQAHFGSIFPYTTREWEIAQFVPHVLRQVHRQRDPDFSEILQVVRNGNILIPHSLMTTVYMDNRNDFETLDVIQSLNNDLFICERPPPDATVIVTTNAQAELINQMRDSELSGHWYHSQAVINGHFAPEQYPNQPSLEFRIGSRVILIKNKPRPGGGYVYVNGDSGFICNVTVNNNVVESIDVQLDRGHVVTVGHEVWEHREYSLDYSTGEVQIFERVTGTYTSLPIMRAWAITAHRAQSQTIEGKVHLQLDGECRIPGQFYTAVSRVRSLDYLSASREISHADIVRSPIALEFCRSIGDA